MSIRHISLLVIFLATGSRAMELSLPEAVRIALEKNRDLIRCGYDLEMASQTYKFSSIAEFKPKASFETKAIHSEKEESKVKEYATEYPSSVSFEQKYPLFLGSQVKVSSCLKITKKKDAWTANPKVGFELSQPLSKSGMLSGNSALVSRDLDYKIASLSYQENV
ncbi:hypothetical protein KKG61_07150, partial [bacterium]|nr:hypothetical protein [bacterium]MBU2462141.1 hypothetical protein [bacterium]